MPIRAKIQRHHVWKIEAKQGREAQEQLAGDQLGDTVRAPERTTAGIEDEVPAKSANRAYLAELYSELSSR